MTFTAYLSDTNEELIKRDKVLKECVPGYTYSYRDAKMDEGLDICQNSYQLDIEDKRLSIHYPYEY